MGEEPPRPDQDDLKKTINLLVMREPGFKISPAIIWTSSIFLGLLSSVPQIAESHFHAAEAAVNAGITAVFALLM